MGKFLVTVADQDRKRNYDLKKVIKLAKERAGLTRHFYPHLLRHAFGTHATMSGVITRSLQYAMGHSSIATTEIYTTLQNEAVINEIRKFGKMLNTVLN